ncbi:MFS domain-containing protein [Meloidogyne graminicola]|uniref:MFS domain-containing protein n=1 Tax=Meloidogyne graminicola TaxID=189291 RepID=A0A8S9ZHA9_9BILA|nr:MFS domain-containing protein [Meloidogyne graminicola]
MNAELVLGWDKIQASSTISVYGLANIFGRISFGLLCDRALPFSWGKDKPRNRLWIYNLTLMFCGFITCFVFAINSFYAFIAYCFFYGFTISSYVCLTSVVLVDLVGVNRLTNAFGLLLFIQGIATFVGPPIAGKLYDLTFRYDWTFALCGICLFMSGAMLFVIPQKNNYLKEKRKLKKKKMPKNLFIFYYFKKIFLFGEEYSTVEKSFPENLSEKNNFYRKNFILILQKILLKIPKNMSGARLDFYNPCSQNPGQSK